MKQFRNIFWGNENYNFYYLPILKNAQTWGKYFFKKNFNFVFLEDKPITITNKKVIVFYRDPVSRWFSGAAQYFVKESINYKILPNSFKIDNLMMNLIFSAGKLDDHTKIQELAFSGLPYESCVFFDTENINFQINLTHYLENVENVKVTYTNLPKINCKEESELKMNIIKQLKEAYDANIQFQEKLSEHLYFDKRAYLLLKNKNMFYSV